MGVFSFLRIKISIFPDFLYTLPMTLHIDTHGTRRIAYSQYKAREKPELAEIVQSSELLGLLDYLPDNTIVVLGGDGTLLEAIHQFYTEDVVFLGINYGTKGFLMNPISIFEKPKKFQTHSYPLLECRTEDQVFVAFNEFDIKAGDGKMLHVDAILLPDHHIEIVGDGIVISTPAGSTGYNASLGWPILPHDTSAFLLTPKAAWKPRGLSPLIISESDTIEIRPVGRKTPVEIYADGQRIVYDFENGSLLTVTQKSDCIRLLVPESESDHWKNKVLAEQGFIQI